jgi:hypothetical protein
LMSAPHWAAPIFGQAEWDEAKTPSQANSSPPRSITARTPSPPRSPSSPRSIAIRTPSPPTIVEALDDPFDHNATNALFISLRLGQWDPFANGSKITQEETDRRRQEDIDCMLKKQREQNNRDMQNILGDVARKSYTKR